MTNTDSKLLFKKTRWLRNFTNLIRRPYRKIPYHASSQDGVEGGAHKCMHSHKGRVSINREGYSHVGSNTHMGTSWKSKP